MKRAKAKRRGPKPGRRLVRIRLPLWLWQQLRVAAWMEREGLHEFMIRLLSVDPPHVKLLRAAEFRDTVGDVFAKPRIRVRARSRRIIRAEA